MESECLGEAQRAMPTISVADFRRWKEEARLPKDLTLGGEMKRAETCEELTFAALVAHRIGEMELTVDLFALATLKAQGNDRKSIIELKYFNELCLHFNAGKGIFELDANERDKMAKLLSRFRKDRMNREAMRRPPPQYYSVADAAAYLASKICAQDSSEDAETKRTRAHLLLFYADATHCAKHRRVLFSETAVKTASGPVYIGAMALLWVVIPNAGQSARPARRLLHPPESKLPQDVLELLDAVCTAFRDMPTQELINLTQTEVPWQASSWNKEILRTLMVMWFAEGSTAAVDRVCAALPRAAPALVADAKPSTSS